MIDSGGGTRRQEAGGGRDSGLSERGGRGAKGGAGGRRRASRQTGGGGAARVLTHLGLQRLRHRSRLDQAYTRRTQTQRGRYASPNASHPTLHKAKTINLLNAFLPTPPSASVFFFLNR